MENAAGGNQGELFQHKEKVARNARPWRGLKQPPARAARAAPTSLGLLGASAPSVQPSTEPMCRKTLRIYGLDKSGQKFPAFVTPCQCSNPRSEHWKSEFLKETIVRICLK